MGDGAYSITNPLDGQKHDARAESVQIGEAANDREAALIAEIARRSDDWFRQGLYAGSVLEAEKCRTASAALAQLANDLRVA